MPEPPGQQVTCPHCSRAYRWRAELSGKTVPCKGCGEKFIVPDTPGVGLMIDPAPADGYEIERVEEEPVNPQADKCPSCNTPIRVGAVICMNCGYDLREGKKMSGPEVEALAPEERKAARKELTGMKWVRGGLWLNMLSILLFVSVVPLTIGIAIANEDLLWIAGIVVLMGAGANMLGSILCLTAPKDSRGRPVLIVSVVLMIVSTVVLFAFDDDLSWISELLRTGANALFLYFFVKLAEYLEFDEIIERARKVLGLYVTIELLSLIPFLPIIGCILLILILGMMIYTLFLYIGLLIDLNNALTYRIGEQSD